MGHTLTEIAEQLKAANKKVQLIYAFNGSGKTRLSREFKRLIAPTVKAVEEQWDVEEPELMRRKLLYYNALTEDLFYWDNDLELDADPKLKIQPNLFTDWVLKEQGQDRNIISYFQRYSNDKLTPHFNEAYLKDPKDPKTRVAAFSEVSFTLERGDEKSSGKLKISKGEESNFIWSIFYTLMEQVIQILNIAEPGERETDQFDDLEYIFIDDPVSSLDENHLIELAVNLAALIKSCESELNFIITTHNPLFYNVLHNELGMNKGGRRDGCFLLSRLEDGTFALDVRYGDSNQSFSYHLYLRETLQKAIAEDKVERYHFTLLRNLYEKTANFLGYPRWSELLPGDKEAYLNRIIQFTSHNTLSNESPAEPSPQEKQTVRVLLDNLINTYGYAPKGD